MTPEISLSDIPKILPHLSEPEKNLILAELEKLEQMKVKERATEKFLVFVKEVWPQFISGRHHAKMADAFERVASGKLKRLIINMPPRHKLLISQEIPTTEGFKTMAEIQPGDCVFSPDGTPTLVTGKSAVYEEEIYEVTTIDGAVIKCDAEHLWTVRWGCGVDAPFKTISTAEILAHQRRFTGVNASAKLPPMSPLQMPERNFLVPPYVLGAWLGDGASASGSMAAHPDDMPHIRARFEAAGVETTDLSTPYIFGTKRLHVKLRKLGVIGNKHIPEEYFLGSESQRKELLQGLIDTDGGVGKCGKVTFHNSNLPLMEDVQLLVRSFGLKATIKERQTKGNHLVQNSKVSYRINFKMEGAASLPRKAERCKTLRGNWARTIRVAKTDRVGKVQCLEVANEDGLFLAGRGYVITHNTKSEFGSYLLPAWFLGKFPEKKIIQTSHTADLAVGFGRKVRNLVDSEPFEKIFPGVALRADSKAAARWDTNKDGSYFALGVGGAVTGKGADIFIIDDPHALEISTPIPTPKGFIEIQDLQVGDEVFGPDGGTTVVTAKSDIWHNRELYSVTTDDNQEILCDAKHLWGVNSDTCLDKARVDNLTAQYLAEWPRKSKPIIPKHQPVGYPEKELPIDPWVLGAWLGDGTSTSGRITADPKNGDQAYMMEEFKKAGYELSEVTADGRTFTVYGLQTQLKKLGVFNNKHVPVAYLQSSVGQRMALLQGLVDTDGAVVKSGQAGFYNCNVQLVDAVVELLHSLGVKCQRRTYKDTRGRWGSAQDNHRVMFRLQDCARIPRKQIYTRTPMDKRSRSITVENTLEKGSVQCISVAREDGLFLAGKGYVVTHNSEQEAAQAEHNPEIYDRVYEWYTSGPRQRLQPGGAMVIIATRWSKRDLVGRVLQDAAERGGEDWEVIEFPAILPSGNTLWPEFWPPEEIMALKEELPVSKWMAQYQQNPTSDVSAIVKREWWQKWEGVKPPVCEFVLTTWDTAFEKNNRADYSAMTTWGVFYRPNDATGVTEANIILLNAFRGKLEFPELKKAFLEHYQNEEPDSVIVEKKASGAPLIYEMRAMGIPVAEFTPTRGNDKISRLNMCSDLFASGRVWAPNKAWAEEVIEEVASFPAGAHDDYVDTVSMAMMRFRQGGYVGTNNDAEDEPEYFKGNKGNGYY